MEIWKQVKGDALSRDQFVALLATADIGVLCVLWRLDRWARDNYSAPHWTSPGASLHREIDEAIDIKLRQAAAARALAERLVAAGYPPKEE